MYECVNIIGMFLMDLIVLVVPVSNGLLWILRDNTMQGILIFPMMKNSTYFFRRLKVSGLKIGYFTFVPPNQDFLSQRISMFIKLWILE